MIHRPDELWSPGHPIPRRPVYPPQRHFPGWIHGTCECCGCATFAPCDPPPANACLADIVANLCIDASSNCCLGPNPSFAYESFVNGSYTIAGDGEASDGANVYCKYESCFELDPASILRQYTGANCITLNTTTNFVQLRIVITIWKANGRVRSIRVITALPVCGGVGDDRFLFVYGTEAYPGVHDFCDLVSDEATCGQVVFFAQHVTDGTGTVTITEP